MIFRVAEQCPPGTIGYHTRDNGDSGDMCAWCGNPITLAAEPYGEGEPAWYWIKTLQIVEWP